MKKMERKKRAYTTPKIKVYPMQNDNLLQAVSGQHEHIGQGGTFGNAKRYSGEEWEDEEEGPTPTHSPKREGSDGPSYHAWEE